MSNTITGNSLYVMQLISPHAKGSALRALRNDKTGIYSIPESGYELTYTFPMPKVDGYAGGYATQVDGGSNANGDFEGVVVSSKVNISAFSWDGLDTATGRMLLGLFVGGDNLTFFAKYYDVVAGGFVIRQFKRGDITYEINNVVTNTNNGVTSLDIDYWKSIVVPVSEV